MIFTIESRTDRAVKTIWFESEKFINICVGEISREHGKWQFHYGMHSSYLKPHVTQAMLAFADDQITLITIKEKLLA